VTERPVLSLLVTSHVGPVWGETKADVVVVDTPPEDHFEVVTVDPKVAAEALRDDILPLWP
jgi:hypothetical protein